MSVFDDCGQGYVGGYFWGYGSCQDCSRASWRSDSPLLAFKISAEQMPENQNCFPGRRNLKSPVNMENVYVRSYVKIANDRISRLG